MKELIILIAIMMLGSLIFTGNLAPAAMDLTDRTVNVMSGDLDLDIPDAKFIKVD